MQGNLCKHLHAVQLSEGEERGGPGPPPRATEGQGADHMICAEAKDEIQYYMSTLRAKQRSNRYDEVVRLARDVGALAGSAELDMDDAAVAGVIAHLKACVV